MRGSQLEKQHNTEQNGNIPPGEQQMKINSNYLKWQNKETP